MELSAIMSPANYPERSCSYSQAITLTNRRQIVQSRKLKYARTTSPSLKLSPVITNCDNAEVIGARECKGKEWIHFVGVGGCGLSALAMLALKQGYEVSGSDMMWSDAMDALREAGARVYVGHSELNLRKNNGLVPDALVVSSAIRGGNVEILHAESVGIPVYKRGAWLGRITKGYNLIAVSGSHGNLTSFVFAGLLSICDKSIRCQALLNTDNVMIFDKTQYLLVFTWKSEI
uniref:UDP-N-acetylmuramate-alanine ligase n=1 Tax=Solanum tuberosum TaxID=4113 RepID=M1AN24_SOLTU